MLSQGNETIHSGNPSYQRCLISGISEDAQQTARDVTNYIIVPLDMLVAVLSLLSNGLVVTAVIRTRSLQSPPLLLLCSLSITDLLWALFSIVRGTERYTSKGLCPEKNRQGAWFSTLCFTATAGNLSIISLDRHSAMCKPFLYRSNVKRSRVLKQACAVWLYSLMSSGLLYAKERSLIFGLLSLIAITFMYVFSIIIIISSYIGILIANIRHKQAIHQHGQGSQLRAIIQRERKLTKTVSFILIVLLLTFVPAICFPPIVSVSNRVSGGVNSFDNLTAWRPLYGVLISLNGLLNPLLNYGRNEDVRKTVSGLIGCPQRARMVVPHPTIPREKEQAHSSCCTAETL